MSKLVEQSGDPLTWGLSQAGADVLNRANEIQERDGGSYQQALIAALVEQETKRTSCGAMIVDYAGPTGYGCNLPAGHAGKHSR